MHKVLVDANVLYSKTLRDWLFLLRQETNMFAVFSTEDILTETIYHLRKNNAGWTGGQIAGVRELIERSLDDKVREYDPQIPYPFNDPNDRHVHAAAVAAGVDFLVTLDGGFQLPAEIDPETLEYEIYTADEFFILADDSSSQAVMRVTERQRHYWEERTARGETPISLADALRRAKCPEFAARVEDHLRTQSGIPRVLRKMTPLNQRAAESPSQHHR